MVVGSSLSLHAAAPGKIFLAFGPKSLLDRALSAPRPGFTPHTITGAVELTAEIDRVRSRGYAVAPEEVLLGANALAAPVSDLQGTLIAPVALVGSIQHIAREPDERLVRIVLDLAHGASRLITASSGRRSGPWSAAGLAAALTGRGVPTPRGSTVWTHTTVVARVVALTKPARDVGDVPQPESPPNPSS